MVRNEVHVAGVRILVFEIDGGGQNLISQGKRGDAGFETPGASEQMTSH